MHTNVLEVVLSDLHQSGVTDVVAENPFDFFDVKILNPFEGSSAALVQSHKSQTDASRPHSSSASEVTKTSKATKEEVDAPHLRDINELVWSFGSANAYVQIVVSSTAEKGDHPLSLSAKVLFEKMLQAIGIKETQVSYIVLNRADKFSSAEKVQVKNIVNSFAESSYKLFVGEDAVKCLFDQSLIRKRQMEMSYEGKPCGLVMHPESLMTQPALKKLAWQDLLKFQSMMKGGGI